MELSQLGVWYFTDGMIAEEAANFAKRIEEMGYGARWIPETVGRHPFAHAAWLLANTNRLVIGTGIASIYNRDAGAAMAGARTLAEQSGGRFILGLGVSHQPLVEGVRGHTYGKPYSTMKAYLEQMKDAPYRAVPPAEEPPVVIAALGPRMLKLAGTAVNGAHPYFTTPEHTKIAREAMGPDAMLCVEQKVLLEEDPNKARELARGVARIYTGLPNYKNSWQAPRLQRRGLRERRQRCVHRCDVRLGWHR
ncbi:MAG: TIGR03620 family F420-dependent LLM class oxidoreductase [Gammaproteobacteria bacterium]|nr:TIGR03620 family F420-dependent LLM class oxidoreductase [Gammaproteobacteria bacterium]